MGRGDKDSSALASSSNPTHSSVHSNKVDPTANLSGRKGSVSSSSDNSKDKSYDSGVYPQLSDLPEPSAPQIEDITNESNSGANELDMSEFKEESKSSDKSVPPFNKQTGKLDLSKYRDPTMLTSIDHLTSIPFQIKSLLWPSVKIGARALMTRESLSLKSLFADLNPHLADEEKLRIKQEEKQKQNQQHEQRSWAAQMAYFLLVGIPSAVLVGLVYGALTFFSNLLKDLYTVASSGLNLLTHAKSDVQYFKAHPDQMPSQDQTVNAITDQVVMPYARTLVKKKLGPISFMAKPADFLLNRVIKTGAINASKILTWASGLPAVQSAAKKVGEKISNASEKKKKREL